MNEPIELSQDEYTVDEGDYSLSIYSHFPNIPDIARPLVQSAEASLAKIERALYTAPGFIDVVRKSVPQETLQAVLTPNQKKRLADKTLKLMTKKDGSLMANLVNPKTNKVVSTIKLEKVELTPGLSQAITDYSTQMQMAQIAEQIQLVQIAVEGVRQGQEYDRLATAYACQQKLLQAMKIQNPELRQQALLRIALDAEDSRNLLMKSQRANADFIRREPETFWGKLINGTKPGEIDARIEEIRDSLCAVNMVSLASAIAYQELEEPEAAKQSLQYYAAFIKKTYLEIPGFVQRLDALDASPETYWSKTIPTIQAQIEALPARIEKKPIKGADKNDMQEMW